MALLERRVIELLGELDRLDDGPRCKAAGEVFVRGLAVEEAPAMLLDVDSLAASVVRVHRDLEHIRAPEELGEAQRRHGVHLVVARHRQQAPDLAQIGFLFDKLLGENAGVDRLQPFEPGLAHMFPVGVDQQHWPSRLAQRLGDFARPVVRSGDQNPVALGLRQAQPPGHRRGGQPVHQHRTNHDQERKRDHHLGAGMAGLLQPEREQGGDRHGHDAPRRQPREEDALARSEPRAHGRQPDRQGPRDEDQQRQEQQRPHAQVGERVQIQPRRQDDEQAGQ